MFDYDYASRSMRRNLDLIEIMRDQFVSSKLLLRCSILCNITVVVISLLTSVKVFRGANVYLPISLLLVQFGAYALRQLSFNYFSRAGSVRTTAMLKDGLGLMISESRLKGLYMPWNPSALRELPFLAQYYTPNVPPGPGKLLQILVESCTSTKKTAQQAFKMLVTLTAITVLGVVTLISLIIGAYPTRPVLVNVNMFALALLSIWAILDLSIMSMRFRELHHSCSRIRSKCLGLQTADAIILDEIMHLACEHNSALGAASPFPIKFCETNKVLFNELWPTRPHQ